MAFCITFGTHGELLLPLQITIGEATYEIAKADQLRDHRVYQSAGGLSRRVSRARCSCIIYRPNTDETFPSTAQCHNCKYHRSLASFGAGRPTRAPPVRWVSGATSSADVGCSFKVVTGARTALHDGELYREIHRAHGRLPQQSFL